MRTPRFEWGWVFFGALLIAGVALAQTTDREAFELGRKVGESVGRLIFSSCCSLGLMGVAMVVLMNGGASFWLSLGVVLIPYVFSWFTLREGYNVWARLVAFGWLALNLVVVIATIIVLPLALKELRERAPEQRDVARVEVQAPSVDVQVTSEPPGATVRVDGAIAGGPTPTTVSFVAGKTVSVRAIKSGFVGETRSITPGTGGQPPIDFQLRPAASLVVTTVPAGATVIVDGDTLADFTPAEIDLAEGGSKRVVAHLDGYVDGSRQVTARVGEKTQVSLELQPGAILQITSDPEGASVFIDGQKQLGVTPITVAVNPKSQHVVKLEHPRLSGATRKVKAGAAGSSQLLSFKLSNGKLVELQRAVARAEAKLTAAQKVLDDLEAESNALVRRNSKDDLALSRKVKAAEQKVEAAQAELDAVVERLSDAERADEAR